MVGLLVIACRFIRACLPVLLALHLAAAQAVMLPSPLVQARPAEQAPQSAGMHCHEMEPAKPMTGHPAGHCEPGQCHCPVAMAQELRVTAASVSFIRRLEPGTEVPGVPSLRQAPDLRPPIAP